MKQTLAGSRALALAGGILLPILETIRRWGTWWVDPPAFLDDWLIAVFLLVGVWATRPLHAARGRAVLSAAWGFACGMLYPSLVGHWQAMQAGEPDPAPIPTQAVFAVKILLGATAIAGLLLSTTAPATSARSASWTRKPRLL
jgi:hypothetical protein